MATTQDRGLSTDGLPDDPTLLKEYIRRLNDMLGSYIINDVMLKEENTYLKQMVKHIETNRSPN